MSYLLLRNLGSEFCFHFLFFSFSLFFVLVLLLIAFPFYTFNCCYRYLIIKKKTQHIQPIYQLCVIRIGRTRRRRRKQYKFWNQQIWWRLQIIIFSEVLYFYFFCLFQFYMQCLPHLRFLKFTSWVHGYKLYYYCLTSIPLKHSY